MMKAQMLVFKADVTLVMQDQAWRNEGKWQAFLNM